MNLRRGIIFKVYSVAFYIQKKWLVASPFLAPVRLLLPLCGQGYTLCVEDTWSWALAALSKTLSQRPHLTFGDLPLCFDLTWELKLDRAKFFLHGTQWYGFRPFFCSLYCSNEGKEAVFEFFWLFWGPPSTSSSSCCGFTRFSEDVSWLLRRMITAALSWAETSSSVLSKEKKMSN